MTMKTVSSKPTISFGSGKMGKLLPWTVKTLTIESSESDKTDRTSSMSAKEFSTDAAEAVAAGNTKYDGGKSPVFRGAISYFPRAISAVAAVSAFGVSKYAWKGWEQVDDGLNRYSDALARHLLYESMGEDVDPDSNLLHASHTAWNALARLELILKERNGQDG